MNLKKALAAVAVATVVAAPAVSHAKASLFGSVQLYAQQQGATQNGGKSSTTFADNGSDIGIKDSTDFGNGLTGFYKIDLNLDVFNGVNANSGSDPYSGGSPNININLGYMGLKGRFGKVVAGRQHTVLYSMIESPTDTPNVLSGPLNPIAWALGDTGGYKSKAPSIAYRSPNMNGFTGGVTYLDIGTYNSQSTMTTAQKEVVNKQQGIYQIGGKYHFGPGYVGAAYMSIPKDNVALGHIKDVWGLAGGYSLGVFGIDANYMQAKPRTVGPFATTGSNPGSSIDSFAVQGSYSKGAWYAYVEYSQLKWKHISDKTATRTVAGVFYQVNNPLQLTFEASRNNKYVGSQLQTGTNDKAYNTFAVGATYSFNLPV